MIIDSHQHFWKFDPVKDAWIDDRMKILRRDFLPADLAPILHKNKVNGCIAVQADQSEKETEFLLQLARKNDFIKGVIGWVDLCAENSPEQIAHLSQNRILKGFRHIVQAEPDGFMIQENFQRGISALKAHDLIYELLIYPKQLREAIALVEKHPKQQFILDHIAKPQISETIDQDWVCGIQTLAKFPNVACKLSGLVTETQDFNWQKVDFKPFLDIITTAFGTDRILFGSDWPVCLLGGNYGQILQIITNYLDNFSGTDRNKVMGLNAARLYKLSIN